MTAREDLLELAFRKGQDRETVFHGCAPCCFLAVMETIEGVCAADGGMEAVYKASSALSGGAGRTTEGHCGALSGGILALGLLYGRDLSGQADPASYAARLGRAAGLANRLAHRFKGEYGSFICREIQQKLFGRSFNLEDPEELKLLTSQHDREKCPSVVGNGAKWTVELILDEEAINPGALKKG